MSQAAPYHADIAGNPDGICHWLTTVDGVRIRVGHWPAPNALGTVLIFPGRTEYIEKYGRTATELTKRGFACVAIDWRGQGIADRLLPNRAVGHVDVFEDYQLDVKAALLHVKSLGLPEPYHLLAHSMGGCIGLRSLYDGLPVKSAVFSAPMWGIKMSPALRPIAWGLSSVSKQLGFGGVFAPGQQAETYVLRATADDNTLTSDSTNFDILQQQLKVQPDLALGGPSLHWLNESLREMRVLAQRPSPDIPCLTFLGSDEAIVDPTRIYDRMANWSNGELVVLEKGRHEVLMEVPDIRTRVLDGASALFSAHSPEMA
ncbi:alpha/beta hydrolase [Octadecabacter sp. 1_MG-2023]|uniref:alpha/beta hydrolase n=1 Tax=unclassified Octadecabacter TaxID=196158 RepID=UPI001C08A26B|nr:MULTISPECIES: alpha/beta hydrolase [unclassified Octadecabacter]MBU2992763.1 alpha/beta hydrolase [Octadecabacter sp. B2R22]MDO6733786.1 alpha/beta hydrolase [Octadecabacter sp. 1_MG-2023]